LLKKAQAAFYHPRFIRVPVACGLLALTLAVLSAGASMRAAGWDVTALPRVDASSTMGAAAKARDPGFHTVAVGAYDGQWYWGIAVDPLAIGDVHQRFDLAPYRYSHPLYGWLGWLLSAGQARAVPWVLLLVSLVSMLVAGVAAGVLGRSGWEGLFVAANPGLVYAASHDTTEALSAALLLGGLLAYGRGRRGIAIACFALLVLSKEPFVFVPAAVAAWELLRRKGRLVDAAALVSAMLPAAAWWIWVRVHLGSWFWQGPNHAFTAPLSGWWDALRIAAAHSYAADPTQNQFGEATIVVLLALGGLLLAAFLVALRLRSPAAAIFLPLVALVACLGPVGTVYERDLLRAASVPLVLVPFILAASAPGRRGSARAVDAADPRRASTSGRGPRRRAVSRR
jgi:hypothetical protein